MVIQHQPLAARRTVTALLLNLAAIVERADESILPAVSTSYEIVLIFLLSLFATRMFELHTIFPGLGVPCTSRLEFLFEDNLSCSRASAG